MKRTLFGILLLLFNCLQVDAQKETSNWFFSGPQGLSFNTGTPQAITGIPPTTQVYDNSISCSDANGNLNFMGSMGDNHIYNRNYAVMPGPSLTGNAFNGRSLWAKYPGSPTKYFVFYAVATLENYDSCYLKYAIIDMSLDGGLGAITVSEVIIDSSLSAGFGLSYKPNSEDFWIINNKFRTDNFYARLVSAAGISASKVTSTAGVNSITSEYNFTFMKASPNGAFIAGATYTYYPQNFGYTASFIEVYNFDQQTGVVSSRVKTPRYIYGPAAGRYLEFSPDNKLLYSVEASVVPGLQPCGFSGSSVTQYDLCYTDSTSFGNYAMRLGSNFFFCSYPIWGNPQLAIDKQIYFRLTGNTISRIQYPNRRGSSATFLPENISVDYSQAQSLPSFNQHEIEKAVKNNIMFTGGCYPTPLHFSVGNDTISLINWNFGDPASGAQNTSNTLTPAHAFSAPGFYTVTAALFNSNNVLIENLTELVEIKDPSIRLLHDYPTDTSYCYSQGAEVKIKLAVMNGIFNWSVVYPNGGPAQQLGTMDSINLSSSGTYYVHMIQNGCDACELIDSIKLTVHPVPDVYLGGTRTLCGNDSIHIGINDYYNNINCVWSTGETTDSIWISSPGQYWVAADYADVSCPNSDTVIVIQNPAVVFSLPADTTLCEGQSLLLDATTANASYSWQNFWTGPTFTVSTGGLYWVTVYVNGCSKTDSIHVNFVSASQINLGRDTTLCAGSSLTLQAGIAGADYLWSTGSVASSIQVNSAGDYWVKVSTSGCWATDTINVQFNPLPYFSLGADTVLCSDKDLLLATAVTADSYSWQDNSITVPYLVNQPGLYWLQIKKDGCSFRDSINIAFKPAPALFLGNDTSICSGTSLQLNAASPNIVSWLWQDGTTNPSITVVLPGTYFTEVTALNGCKKKDSIVVSTIALPSFTLGNDTSICSARSLTLQTNISGMPHLWSNGSTANQITVNTAGLYWVEVDNSGCKKKDTINLSIKNFPVVKLGNDTLLCNNATMLLNAANDNALYLWQDGSTAAQFMVTIPGSYSVSVDKSGCIEKDTIAVSYKTKPDFSLGGDREICEGSTIILDPHVAETHYLWNDGSTGSTFTIHQPGTYSLTITNECGTANDAVLVNAGICDLYVPNSFTPDGNGTNDEFKVSFKTPLSFFDLKIYNRYGQLVFQSADKVHGWDGKLKGEKQPIGTYIWVLKYALQSSSSYMNNANGTITLIR